MASEAIHRLQALMGEENLPLRSQSPSIGVYELGSKGARTTTSEPPAQEASSAQSFEIAESESSGDKADAKHTVYSHDTAAEEGEWHLSPLRKLPSNSLHPEILAVGADRSSGILPGEEAKPEDAFCPLQAVVKLPYKFMEKEHKNLVSEAFFAKGKFWERDWDM